MDVEIVSGYVSRYGQEYSLAYVRDITARRRMEDALQEANRKLNLLAGVTRHDILNKVSSVLGFLKIAEMKLENPLSAAPYLKKIEDQVVAIRTEIEFTREYENIGAHEPRWIDLGSMLPQLPVPGTIAFRSAVNGVAAFADPMLGKVFSNLLDNSIRHGRHVTEIRVSGRVNPAEA